MNLKRTGFLTVLFAFLMIFSVVAEQVFEKIPPASVVNLKITSPKKAVRSGYVFVNGEYIPPPYRVIRYGTGIKINGKQVTGEVVPWKNFTTAYNQQAKDDGDNKPVKKQVRRKKEVNSLDDLFDDTPSSSSSDDENEAEESSDEEVSKDNSSSEAGEYVKDARTKALLKRINNYRSQIHRQLLDGGVCFFGVEYSQIHIPSRIAPRLLDLLPNSIRDAQNASELHHIFRGKGYPFMCVNLCDDLLKNAADTAKIVARRRKERAKEDARNVINRAVSGEL